MPKVSKTEKKLLKALNDIGLNPESQYSISKHHVDFAFPDYKLAIEVDGIHHRTRKQKEIDERRRDVAESEGWKVRRFNAEDVHENPHEIADNIRWMLAKRKSNQPITDSITEKKTVEKTFKPRLPQGDAVGKSFAPIRRFDKWKRLEYPQPKDKTFNPLILILLLLLLLGALFIWNYKNLDIISGAVINEPELIKPTPKPKPLIVEVSKTELVIQNNQNKDTSVEVTFRIFSKWFGIDSTETKIFNVDANSKKSFTVYNNAGCKTAPCSVSIVDFKEVICDSNYYNCEDFLTQAKAQAVLDACGSEDIHLLDKDGDGVACESLT